MNKKNNGWKSVTVKELLDLSKKEMDLIERVGKCIICDGVIVLSKGTEKSEIIECSECGSELEIISINPIKLDVAPKPGEDWGE